MSKPEKIKKLKKAREDLEKTSWAYNQDPVTMALKAIMGGVEELLEDKNEK